MRSWNIQRGFYRRRSLAKWITLAVGGASAISATAVLLTAANRTSKIQNELDGRCDGKGCPDGHATRLRKEARLDGLRTGFIVSTSVAGAVLATSLGLWLVEVRGRSRPDSPPVESATLSFQRSF